MGCGSSSQPVVVQQTHSPRQEQQQLRRNFSSNNNHIPAKHYSQQDNPPPPILLQHPAPQQPLQQQHLSAQLNQPTAPPVSPEPEDSMAYESADVDTPLPEVLPHTPQEPTTKKKGPACKLTEEVLQEFVELDKQIQELESEKAEEKLVLLQIEYKNMEEACRMLRDDYESLKQNTLKEYEDVAKFDLVAYMVENKMAVIGDDVNLDEQKQKEEYEYCEARNKQDIAEKQLKSLENQLTQISRNIEKCQQEIQTLLNLRVKVDGLLENIFNGEYGSDLEDRLELEAEQLLQYKQHLSLAHYKWWNGRQLLHHACSQIAYSVRRWAQIRDVAEHDGNAKYHMVTDTRNHMIACHQNIQRAAGYLDVQLPYWNNEDDTNLVSSVNVIYNDVRTGASYHKALRWYRFYHWRLALLLNWMDQVINNKIVADHQRVSKDFRNKYKELRLERLRCIKEKVHEVLGAELDIGQFTHTDETEDNTEEDELPKVESDIVIDAATFLSEQDGEIDMPAAIEAESDPTLIQSVVLDPGTLKALSMGLSTETNASSTFPSDTGTETISSETQKPAADVAVVQASETGTDVGVSTTTETGTDAGVVSTTTETGTDAGISTTTETGTDAGFSTTTETGTDAGVSTTTETGTDAGVSTTAETGTDSMCIQTGEMSIGTDPMPTQTFEMATGTGTSVGPPDVKLIPLEELAPPPSDAQLFGNMEQLQLLHQKQLEEFEKVQTSNKTRQEQGLQEKLRQRQSRRRKQQMQEEQENALTLP